jgi:hypothetical protein
MVVRSQEISKKPHHGTDLAKIAQAAAAGLGVAFAIGGMEWSSVTSDYPLVLIPFATSIVLVVGSPEAEPAQPRALIGDSAPGLARALAVRSSSSHSVADHASRQGGAAVLQRKSIAVANESDIAIV